MRAPISYYGGKGRMYKQIIKFFPPHVTYIEPFGGAAWVLLNKERSPVEVYNDINGEVVNLFRVLRNEGEKLRELLQLTPYARDEFVDCLNNHCDDPVEQARRTFVRFRQGFNSKGKSAGCWSYTRNLRRKDGKVRNSAGPQLFSGVVERELLSIIDRLREVHIENLDCFDLIPRYDSIEALFYCDPPYLLATRVSKNDYPYEFSAEQHQQLLTLLQSLQGMVILSGYRNKVYDEVLKNWSYSEYNLPCYLHYRIGVKQELPRRREGIWLNPAAVKALELSESRQPELMG